MNQWSSIHRFAIAVGRPCGHCRTRAGPDPAKPAGYDALVQLFNDWRAFERPPFANGAPDYTAATFARRHQELAKFRARLDAIDPAGWPVEQQVDHALVRAEMNGLDFDLRVLQPWARDPAFYKIDLDRPERHAGARRADAPRASSSSGPTPSRCRREARGEARRRSSRIVPPLLAQARRQPDRQRARPLDHAAPARCSSRSRDLDALAKKTEGSGQALKKAIAAAREATVRFRRLARASRRRRRPAPPASARRTTPGACATCTSCR